MCTAATYKTGDFYFGRTLDYEFSYGDDIVITPRNCPISYRNEDIMNNHYAIMGISTVVENTPLYHEGINERGLCMAGLNFVGNAYYRPEMTGKNNISHFELIPWILSQCASVKEARTLIGNLNITDTQFNENLPAAYLHWIIADKHGAVTLESVKSGIKVYDNPPGILTNNPPFDKQMFQLNNYMNLSPKNPVNHFSSHLELEKYSRGMGAIGLPGDLSSQSRFIRASFVKMNSVSEPSENKSVSQLFHILGAVDQMRGCCEIENGQYEITLYTACYNADKGIIYYTSYDNHRINAIDMRKENLDSGRIIIYPMITDEQIRYQN